MKSFESLNNTRDLADIKGLENRIKKGRLIRSGQLYFASEEDISRFENMNLRLIVDFRTSREREEKPDPGIKNALNIHLPVFDESKQGITKEEETRSAFSDLVDTLRNSPKSSLDFMKKTYRDFITDEHAQRKYREFLNLLLENEDGAALWHCTAGKDRAGFATILVLAVLGIEEEIIREDYISTNEYLKGEIESIFDRMKNIDPATEHILRDFFLAREEYVNVIYEGARRECGSLKAFITDRLGFDEEKQERFREIYLI